MRALGLLLLAAAAAFSLGAQAQVVVAGSGTSGPTPVGQRTLISPAPACAPALTS